MAETNKDKWVNNFANAIGANNPTISNDPNNGGGNEQPDKYAALETTSYKDMLSSKIQASAAKEQADKYASTVLGANGFGTQGVSESAKVGIANNYAKAIAGADEKHQANMLDIENQRQTELENKKVDNWQSAMTMLSQATSKQDLDYVKSNFYDSMDDTQKKMFDYYYASYSTSFADTGKLNSLDALNNATYEKENGNVGVLKDAFEEETKLLWHHGSKGDYEAGDVIKITNGEKDTIYMKWGGNGFTQVSKEEYEKAKDNNVNSFEITRGDKKNNIYNQTNKKS